MAGAPHSSESTAKSARSWRLTIVLVLLGAASLLANVVVSDKTATEPLIAPGLAMFNGDIVDFLTNHFGTLPFILFVFLLLLAPVAVVVVFVYASVKQRRGRRNGLLLGLGMAFWASLCWLIVPYCGGYACLPGLVCVVLLEMSGVPVGDVLKEILIHVTNFIVWPVSGWLVGMLVDSLRGAQRHT